MVTANPGARKKKDAAESVDAVERELTERFFGVMQRIRQFTSGQSAELGLSVVQARALVALRESVPMRTLADRLGLDPANLTSVVDRLEERGLVTRQPHPQDRRVKLLELTPTGRASSDDLLERVFRVNPVFSGLSSGEQSRLSDLLAKVLATVDAQTPNT
jgi:DNA-binding MarR family transcriptional regulator